MKLTKDMARLFILCSFYNQRMYKNNVKISSLGYLSILSPHSKHRSYFSR